MADAIALSAAEIAAATGGRVVSGRPDRRTERWSIDTRSMAAGDLFVAVRGDRFDGHEFVAAALAAGAAGAVVTETPALPEAGTAGPAPLLIQVADTTRALQDARARSAPPIGREGRRDHRQRGQDDDEGAHRGVPVGEATRCFGTGAT